MCGIAGHIWTDPRRPAEESLVRTMCDVLWHRGPDGGGVWSEGPVAFGHRRLSILDLSPAGRQPMSSRDGSVWITFNGEIYNYRELRDELKAGGSQFRSQTDTEVVLEAYRVWGADCVSRFNGMWAFAIYDAHRREVFLSRDRIGIKPLYYLYDSTALVFASEIKAILAVRPENRTPRWSTLARFLSTGVRDEGPETSFRDVLQLPPAHNAVYDVRRNRLQVSRYWQIDPCGVRTISPNEAVDECHSLLESAIDLHLRSDVPVGTCLSGGIDSSTIVALMSGQRGDPVHTFSGLYSDADCNEEGYVDSVNSHTGAISCPVRPEPYGDLVEDLAAITWHQDEPTAGPGLYTQYHVMKRAQRYVKVILDGQGGDELFGGYLFYFQSLLADAMKQRPIVGRLQSLPVLTSMAWNWGLRTSAAGWNTWCGGALTPLLKSRRRRSVDPATILSPDLVERGAADASPRPSDAPFPDSFTNALYEQVTATSLPTLLHYEDRNSMAWSLEARVPLLDYRLVEFAFSLPARLKIRGSWTKWTLRKVCERILPPAVAWRRSKMGYPTPMGRWFRRPQERDAVEELLFSSSTTDAGLFEPRSLRRIWDEHQAGRDHTWLLYRSLTTELWRRQSVEGRRPNAVAEPPRSSTESVPSLTQDAA